MRFIREHLTEPLRTEDIASTLDVSKRSLERAFRASLSLSPHEYLLQERVQLAKKLLTSEAELSTEEVARQCGFSDARRMRIVFRRLAGSNPRRYRYEHLKAAKNEEHGTNGHSLP